MKRALSLLLVLCMILSLVPAGIAEEEAFAEETFFSEEGFGDEEFFFGDEEFFDESLFEDEAADGEQHRIIPSVPPTVQRVPANP